MATTVIMPRQGQSVESCIITSISKKENDTVNIGDILFSYETDKSSFDEISTVSGKMLKMLYEEGDDVECLEAVCIIGEDSEDISSLTAGKNQNYEKKDNTEILSGEPLLIPQTSYTESSNLLLTSTEAESGQYKISPRAKEYALKSNADLSKVIATGPDGRIIERDIIALMEKGFRYKDEKDESDAVYKETEIEKTSKESVSVIEHSQYEDVKLPNVRKVIAKAMTSSLSAMAQLTLNSSFDASQILKFRAKLKTSGELMGLTNITLNDIILFATTKTLLRHKDLNANYFDDCIRYFNCVNMGVAVDTDRGLLVPVLFNAEKLSLNELAKQTKELISQAQKGTVSPDKLKGGSFTVTNLGSLGIESFTPVINPPQTGILGVNNITKRIKENSSSAAEFYDCMTLSLTFDHRALDGAPAARFLKDLCTTLENFDLLLAK